MPRPRHTAHTARALAFSISKKGGRAALGTTPSVAGAVHACGVGCAAVCLRLRACVGARRLQQAETRDDCNKPRRNTHVRSDPPQHASWVRACGAARRGACASADRRLGADGKELEDGEHAAGADVVAVDEAEGVGDGVPHALDGAAGAAEGEEPLGEGDVVEVAHHLHAAVKVDEGADDRGGAEADGVHDLVVEAELLRRREGFEAVEGRADAAHAEVEGARRAALIDEDVRVLLEAERAVEGAHALEDAEEVVVAAEKDVEAHLDVVAVLIHPAAHFATDEVACLEQLDLVAGIRKIHRGHHPCQARSDDTNTQF